MPSNILSAIVRQKKKEVEKLKVAYDLEDLRQEVTVSHLHFYKALEASAHKQKPFVITEFKRKSPSEGWINKDKDLAEQARVYVEKGASAMSVLTDSEYFGGSYEDLLTASKALEGTGVLLLQKDFIIDPIQIYLARKAGANLILLIAAILEEEELRKLKAVAEGLGMGVLAEVHSLEEYNKIASIDFPVVGINNRDLTNFKTALNCCNYIAQQVDHQGYIIAESGMGSALDLRIARQHANGYLIGTSLMRGHQSVPLESLTAPRLFFKACGIRTAESLVELHEKADLLGINFSPISKRRGKEGWLQEVTIPSNAVAVFKNNTEDEIEAIASQYGFRYVQLYSSDVKLDFIKRVKQKVILAVAVRTEQDWKHALQFAPYIDLFLLDGPKPGSGEPIHTGIPADFPYPFLLAGGMNASNIDRVLQYENCIGVDMASGIEEGGEISHSKAGEVANAVKSVSSQVYKPLVINE